MNLKIIRQKMKEQKIDAYFIPRSDPHQSEYMANHWELVDFVSGFNGSAANLIITQHFAGLWTDSRYFIQAVQQLKGTGIQLMKLQKSHTPEYFSWLAEHLNQRDNLAFDGRLISQKKYETLKEQLSGKSINFHTNTDLVSGLWTNRPVMPSASYFELSADQTGESRKHKIARLRTRMKGLDCSAHFISNLDEIAWLLNIRGRDSEFTPLPTAYFLLTLDEIFLFTRQDNLPDQLKNTLKKDGIQLFNYMDCEKVLKSTNINSRILLDINNISAWAYELLKESFGEIKNTNNPCIDFKAIKNTVEIENFEKAMYKDGIALVKFYKWLEENLSGGEISEMSVADKLVELRTGQGNFICPSFASIAGYKAHGALNHYKAVPETNSKLANDGLFLLDSGAQYLEGTTDITRTVSLGNTTEQERIDFTLVLKGFIQLSKVSFPKGTSGNQLEVLAKHSLWTYGFNFQHGTGHGVGHVLNVHEGPHAFGSGGTARPNCPLVPGMMITNEPGLYREGKYGIRTENLMLVVEGAKTEFGDFLKFESLTLFPIESNLIKIDLLETSEIDWLNKYHKKVYTLLKAGLNEEEKKWLENKTKIL